MKSTWTKILFSALVLTLAACSGGGGGGGGGSVSGDVANPTPTISNPPTKASGTAADLGSVLGTDEAGTTTAVQAMINEFELPNPVMSPALKNLEGESCYTANAGWNTDLDSDRFYDNAKLRAVNCPLTKGGEGVGTAFMNASLDSTDSNTATLWANASTTFSTKSTFKNASGQAEGEYYYSFKSTLDMSKGSLSINAKEGGYDKTKNEASEYSAFWLTFTATEQGVVSLSGYVQEYAEGKGLVTLQVIGTGGSINEGTECIDGMNVSLKYANGDVAGSVTKTLCLAGAAETSKKAGLK